MAMQGPIDTFWHEGIEQAGAATAPSEPSEHDHHHDHDHDRSNTAEPAGLRKRIFRFLDELAAASTARTNPKPASNAQKFNTRRQIENKLRFAYQLDPSHYANYNAYHFFLTEPELGTRPQLTPQAAGLADRTIRYCLSRTDDPRPALTAAAATENLLELMFNDRAAGGHKFPTSTMREYLQLLDHCISRYQALDAQWTTSGQWNLLSPQRQLEARERLNFTVKVRDAAEGTIVRLESQESTTSGSSPSN